MKKTNNKQTAIPERRVLTSFCCNCGVPVRYGVKMDDKKCNREICTDCGPLLAKYVDADIKEQLADESLNKAIDEKLPDGVMRTVRVMTKKEIAEATTTKRVVTTELRKRRQMIGSVLGRLAKQQ